MLFFSLFLEESAKNTLYDATDAAVLSVVSLRGKVKLTSDPETWLDDKNHNLSGYALRVVWKDLRNFGSPNIGRDTFSWVSQGP